MTQKPAKPQKVRRPLSLRRVTLILAAGIIVAFALVLSLVYYGTMPYMLEQSETKYITEQMEMVRGLFEETLSHAVEMTADMGIWENTVRYMQGDSPDFFTDNWPDSSPLEAYGYNYIIFHDTEGGVVYEEYMDYTTGERLPAPQGFAQSLAGFSARVLSQYDDGPPPEDTPLREFGESGILFYGGTPYSLAAAPIVRSPSDAVPAGTVSMGSVLNNRYFREITHYDALTFEWVENPGEAELSEDAIVRVSGERVATALILEDINGAPALLRMSDARPIYAAGQASITQTFILLLAVVILLILAVFFVMQRLFMLPIERLGRDLGAITATGGQVDTRRYGGSREFGLLTGAINDMLARLGQSNVSIATMQNILNGVDAYLYVTDPDSDEILFMNNAMRRHYGIEDGAVGQKCWRLLQTGIKGRCTFCPIPRLKENPETPVVWEEHSTVRGRYFRNTDSMIRWTDNRLVHVQHSVDITDIKTAGETLKKRLQQQQLMTAMAQSFLSSEDEAAIIGRALAMAGEFTGVSKILFARLDKEAGLSVIEHEWYNPGQEVPRLSARAFPYAPGDGMYNAFENGADILAVDEVEAHPEHGVMTVSGVKSFMTAPIYAQGKLWGLVSFDECRAKRRWADSDLYLLRLIAGIFSGLITHGAVEKDLKRMSSIVAYSPQFIAYIGRDGHFEYVNPAALSVTGYSYAELMAGGLGMLHSKEDFTSILTEQLPEALIEGQYFSEMELVRKGGERRIIQYSIFTAGMNGAGAGVIATDVTRQRRLEEDLVSAKVQAEQSSLAKSNFLSRMSHEMRTPMNAVIGMTGIALAAKNPGRKDYCLAKIDEASNHLLGVINDILDVSKIEAGKFELSESAFVFEKMLQRVTGVMNFRVDEKRQTLMVKIDSALPAVICADEQRLAQVVTNLLSNAVKFTPEGGTITLTAECLGIRDGAATLRLDVADTGIGVPAGQQARLFQSFEQGDGGIARKYGGTGLGLSISKSIVELMGGRIWVVSEEGKGATFSLQIEVKAGDPAQSGGAAPVEWASLRALVVDDAPEVLEYFEEMAGAIGFRCSLAGGGGEALRLLATAQKPYNILFVDYRMPEMDGIELTREIRRKYAPKAPVIMISAAQWEDIEDEARKAGVDAFLPKPLFPSRLVDCVNSILNRTAPPKPPCAQTPRAGRYAGRRVLLAEDIEINREIVAAMLDDTGIELEDAENGAEAVRKFGLAPEGYDLILMDIHMPEMDGYEATRRIRALASPKAAKVPIVAMTANVFREDIQKCLAAGMNDHIGKPVDVDDLFAKLGKYLTPPG